MLNIQSTVFSNLQEKFIVIPFFYFYFNEI